MHALSLYDTKALYIGHGALFMHRVLKNEIFYSVIAANHIQSAHIS